ncbi:hypothetical protein [Sphingomonas sp.]|uniref:hypothetical protein n=1 Tax=Sphingomonas sp. TaxID=28214 RepID=UPI0035C8776F
MSTAVLGRLVARARERGLSATARKLFEDHVWRRSSSVIMEYRREWGGGVGREFEPADGFRYEMVEPGQPVPPLGRFLARRRGDFERMLADRKVGAFVSDEEGAFSCLWLSFEDHRDPESREFYAVAPGEVYHYCWLLDPEKRKSNAALNMMRYVFAYAKRRGVTRQFGVIDRVNRPSYQIHKRFHYREAGIEVIHLYLLRTRWTFTRPYKGELGLYANAGRTG